MKYSKERVMEIVEQMLGDNAKGIYVCDDVVNRDENVDTSILYSNCSTVQEIIPTNSIDVQCGLTKIVLIPNNENFVIKIPYTDIYSQDSNNSTIFQTSKFPLDYCEKELCKYLSAQRKVASHLAEIQFVDFYYTIPIYVQQKIPYNAYQFYKCTNDLSLNVYNKNIFTYLESKLLEDNVFGFSSYAKMAFLKIYGVIGAIDIIESLEEYAGDIHAGNYGFNSEGKPIVFDYAGYEPSEVSLCF